MFLIGFNRDRDNYQVPLAFAEIGQLGLLVTDYYRGSLPVRLRRLGHRVSPGIPPEKTRSTLSALALQAIWQSAKTFGLSLPLPEWHVDRLIAGQVRSLARRHREWDLLIYSSFAGPAFTSASRGRRILFQFHPFPTTIREVMLRDAANRGCTAHYGYPEVAHYERMCTRHRIEVAAADHIICTSSFTRLSLEASGLTSAPTTIIPYGCPDVPDDAESRISRSSPTPVRFLFVGNGPRKGLHHLIDAWRRIDRADMTLRSLFSRPTAGNTERDRRSHHCLAEAAETRIGRTHVAVRRSRSAEPDRRFRPCADGSAGPRLLSCGYLKYWSPRSFLDDRVHTIARPGDVDDLAVALLAAREKLLSDTGTRKAALDAARARPWVSFRRTIVETVSQTRVADVGNDEDRLRWHTAD